MRTQGGAAGGVSAPTADAGSNITTNDTTLVTLNGSGSTAGATMSWSLVDPAGVDQTSRLSSTTVISPTFTPLDIPGVWVATLQVTVGAQTSQDNCTIRVGDANGWIRLNPDAATSTASGGHHSTVTWSDDGSDWTTVTLSAKTGGSVLRPEDFELKWFEPNVAQIASIFSIDFKITADETLATQPALTDFCFAGIVYSNTTTIPSSVGFYVLHTVTNQSENTRNTCRGNLSNIAWANSSSGYDSTQGAVSFKPYVGAHQRCTYNKTTVHGSSHPATSATSITFSPSVTWSDPLKFALAAGRSGSTSGDKTFRFQVWYRIQQR